MKKKTTKVALLLLLTALTAGTAFAQRVGNYEVVTQALNWADAKAEAERRGGHLAVITSAEEQRTIESLLAPRTDYWIGGYRDGQTFKWVTGEPMNYTNWSRGNPDNGYGGTQDRIQLWNGPQWDDERGAQRKAYIIEYPSSSSRYEVVTQALNWADAKAEAERRGGHLAVITSAEEQAKIAALVNHRGGFWIGGYREGQNFRWVTGEPFTYTSWARGQPDNGYNSTQDRIQLYTNADWDDDRGANRKPYIIEWD